MRAPPSARARVRQRLSSAAAAAGTGGVKPRTGAGAWLSARARTVALVAASFGAGYWLGFERGGAERSGADRPHVERALPSAGDGVDESTAGVAQKSATRDAGDRELDVSARAEAELAAARRGAPVAEVSRAPELEPFGAAPRARARRLGSAPPTRPVVPHRRSARSRSSEDLAAELALLQRAERAIRAGEGALARALVGELEQRFPASQLGQERAAARVLAECVEAQRGDASARATARAHARQLLASGTVGVYADRIRALCELDVAASEASAQEPAPRGH